MRKVLCTGILVAIATVSAAQALPITKDASSPSETASRADVTVTRPERSESSTLATQSENKPDRERQVLSRNFHSKPVQIYWFFGGR